MARLPPRVPSRRLLGWCSGQRLAPSHGPAGPSSARFRRPHLPFPVRCSPRHEPPNRIVCRLAAGGQPWPGVPRCLCSRLLPWAAGARHQARRGDPGRTERAGMAPVGIGRGVGRWGTRLFGIRPRPNLDRFLHRPQRAVATMGVESSGQGQRTARRRGLFGSLHSLSSPAQARCSTGHPGGLSTPVAGGHPLLPLFTCLDRCARLGAIEWSTRAVDVRIRCP